MMSRLAACAAALALVAWVAACGSEAPARSAPAGASVSVPGASSAPASSLDTSSAGGLAVGAKAFGGHGRLAFVSDGRLYVLDGSAPGRVAALHAVSTGKAPGAPGGPAWSPDGRWLAFLVGTPAADGAVTSGALWLAGPDGQDPHQVLPKVAGFAWSPTADELAATSGYGGKLFAVRPGRPAFPMLEVPGPFDGAPAWSPSGRELAVAVLSLNAQRRFAGSAIDLFVPAEGLVVNHFAVAKAAALIVDAWWPTGEGLLAWSDPRDSASAAANGLPLASYPLDGRPATLGSTLAYPSFAQPRGAGAILVTGGDRYPWSAKTIQQCSASGPCAPAMDAAPAPVNLDPAAASENGEPTLAFAHAAREAAVGLSQRQLKAWYQTARLWLWEGGGNPRPVSRAGVGVAAPTWSADGRDILYVRDNALWLVPMFTAAGRPSNAAAAPVVGALFAGQWPASSGYTAWPSQFAWYS